MSSVTYLIYAVFWETLIWGGGAYLIIEHDWSIWTLALSFVLSMMAYGPARWRQAFSDSDGSPKGGNTEE